MIMKLSTNACCSAVLIAVAALPIASCSQAKAMKAKYVANRYGDAVSYLLQHDQKPSGWSSIETAPHEGTIVEIRSAGGDTPNFGLYRWLNGQGWTQVSCGPGGPNDIALTYRQGGIIGDGPWLSWRQYKGRVEDYVSPAKADHEIYYDRALKRCWATFWPRPNSPEGQRTIAELDRERREAAQWSDAR